MFYKQGTKYLILRPKYMRKLESNNDCNDSIDQLNVTHNTQIISNSNLLCNKNSHDEQAVEASKSSCNATPNATSNQPFPGDSLDSNVSLSAVANANNVVDDNLVDS